MSEADYTITALMRGLKVLELFSRERPRLSVPDIQKLTGYNRTTVFRVVVTLIEAGYLEQVPDTKQYQPSLKVLQLGFSAIANMEVRQLARPYLERLAWEADATVTLSVLDNYDVVYIDRVRHHQFVNSTLGIGSRMPAHCVSMGRVILAYLPPHELQQWLDNAPLRPCSTSKQAFDRTALEGNLTNIRAQGFAVWLEELEIGIRAVAAPIWAGHGEVVASINIVGTSQAISQNRLSEELTSLVCQYGLNISQALGYRPNTF